MQSMHSSLIQHELIARGPDRPKITIGPKSECDPPEIKLNKTGDTIDSIEISCRCGEKIRIQCQYD